MSEINALLTAEDLVDAALCWLHDDSLDYFLETRGWTDEQQLAWEKRYKEQIQSFADQMYAMIEQAAKEGVQR